MALPKPYRLRDRKDFERVYRRAQRSSGPDLLLRIAPQPKTLGASPAALKATPAPLPLVAPSRIAVVVSLKVSKRAVVRNRLRRQVLAAIQQLLPQLNRGNLIIITVKPSAVGCDYPVFLQQLELLLQKTKALHGH